MPERKLQHVLKSQQFSRRFLEEELFPETDKMKKVAKKGGDHSLRGRRTYNLFYEPSTRTRVSFETAIDMLGGQCKSTENAGEFSSAVKGETLEDTVRIIEGYGYDAIVIRHKEEGAAERAASVAKRAAIINAGDGTGQHPTQALLDVYTIHKFLGDVKRKRIAVIGDLKHGRTANSLIYLASKFPGVSFSLVAPEGYGISDGIRTYLEKHDVPFTEGQSVKEAIREADADYLTRPQLERHGGNAKKDFEDFILDRKTMIYLPKHAIVMHPLPRNHELPDEVMGDKRVVVFKQAKNGLYIRMALFEMMLGK